MNKAYIIWPFAGLLVFGAFYWNFSKDYALRQQKAEQVIQEQKKEKTRKELELRKKAIEDAIAAQQVRMAARAAKEKKEEEEKAARAALMDRRTKAYDDVNKRLHPQLERLKSDADEIKDQLAKLDPLRMRLDGIGLLRKCLGGSLEDLNVAIGLDKGDPCVRVDDGYAFERAVD